ncbi:superoxide dismutase family protein [Sphingomonas cavernae]|uniref:Superoxide dismutase family protein n=1 Tax=Sphingomonas cavernae TaxID=2320861 RepID=A0A418WL72_9SPHN|nr:superoxide dismutase family protein [Sphingomonas cavernae]RJF90801.1 superoxide dismutase family protein [Sphingomonas cavernae]
MLRRDVRQLGLAAALLALGLSGCAANDTAAETPAPAGPASARATLQGPTGNALGSALIEDTGHGLKLTVTGTGLPQGAHGTHIHMVGRCDAPDFASAGSHWNPTGAQHGKDNPQGAHAGDLPNLLIGTDGQGSFTIDLHGAKMSGPGGLLDEDGAALVVHTNPDDLKTDPTGNSGGRIACGAFVAG